MTRPNFFAGNILMITGETGFFSSAVLNQFLETDDTLFMAKFKPHVKRMCITNKLIYYYFQRSDPVSHAGKASLHCSCIYKLANEYRELSKEKFVNFFCVEQKVKSFILLEFILSNFVLIKSKT